MLFLGNLVGPQVPATLHLFYEAPRPSMTIFAFNSDGALWFSLGAFARLHQQPDAHGRVPSVWAPEVTSFWLVTLACADALSNAALKRCRPTPAGGFGMAGTSWRTTWRRGTTRGTKRSWSGCWRPSCPSCSTSMRRWCCAKWWVRRRYRCRRAHQLAGAEDLILPQGRLTRSRPTDGVSRERPVLQVYLYRTVSE